MNGFKRNPEILITDITQLFEKYITTKSLSPQGLGIPVISV